MDMGRIKALRQRYGNKALGKNVEALLNELRDSDKIQTSAYMFIAQRVRSGKVRKTDLERIVDFVKHSDFTVSSHDLAEFY